MESHVKFYNSQNTSAAYIVAAFTETTAVDGELF